MGVIGRRRSLWLLCGRYRLVIDGVSGDIGVISSYKKVSPPTSPILGVLGRCGRPRGQTTSKLRRGRDIFANGREDTIMDKPFDYYSVEIHSSVGIGLAAQILCDQGQVFAGRIDFYREQEPPVSYLWTPTGSTDPNQTYIVLAMSLDLLKSVITLLEHGGPWELELWPSGPLTGVSTNGYGGLLKTIGNITVPTAPLNIRAIREQA